MSVETMTCPCCKQPIVIEVWQLSPKKPAIQMVTCRNTQCAGVGITATVETLKDRMKEFGISLD